jgi:hypothetical protein
MRIRMVILALLLAVISRGTPAHGGAARAEKPVILGASLSSSDGLLVGDLTCAGIFSERIAGTIQSGLPAVVELLYRLVRDEGGTAIRGLHAYELRYDVWEDRYSMKGDSGTTEFASFEGISNSIEHLRSVAIIPIARLDRDAAYAVQFSIAVHPLQGMERERIAGWVGEQMRNDADDSWRENVLDLNDLIQHFLSREKDTANRSPWYQTEFFKPGDLPPAKEDR